MRFNYMNLMIRKCGERTFTAMVRSLVIGIARIRLHNDPYIITVEG